jgi:anti-sigma-K factor RskA
MSDQPMSHEAIMELLGAFAIDAVEPGEAVTIQDHLAGCVRCRDEVAQLQQAAAMLGNHGAKAPAEVWDSISTRIVRPVDPSPAAPPLEAAAGTSERLIHASRKYSIGLRVAAALAAAAAVAAIAVLGVEVGRLNHRLSEVAATASSDHLSAAARAALLDPQARRVVLTGSGGARQDLAVLVSEPSGATFLFNNLLVALTGNRTYQLWQITGGRAVSLGLLGADPTTVALGVTSSGQTVVYAVSVEPDGGSVGPTSTPVASSGA